MNNFTSYRLCIIILFPIFFLSFFLFCIQNALSSILSSVVVVSGDSVLYKKRLSENQDDDRGHKNRLQDFSIT